MSSMLRAPWRPDEHLVDESGFEFDGLPHVHVEAAVGDVAHHVDGVVLVALADDAALALFDVGGPPRAVEVVQRDAAGLDVGADAHLLGGPDEHRHIAVAAGGEELLLLACVAGFVHEPHLGAGDTACGRVRCGAGRRGPSVSRRVCRVRRTRAATPPGRGCGFPAGSLNRRSRVASQMLVDAVAAVVTFVAPRGSSRPTRRTSSAAARPSPEIFNMLSSVGSTTRLRTCSARSPRPATKARSWSSEATTTISGWPLRTAGTTRSRSSRVLMSAKAVNMATRSGTLRNLRESGRDPVVGAFGGEFEAGDLFREVRRPRVERCDAGRVEEVWAGVVLHHPHLRQRVRDRGRGGHREHFRAVAFAEPLQAGCRSGTAYPEPGFPIGPGGGW